MQMAAVAARSAAEWAGLNRAVSKVEAGGIRRRHPDYDDQQILRAQARLRYGDELVAAGWPGEPLVDP